MINLVLLRDDSARVKELVLRKDPSFPIDELIKLDNQARSIRSDIESLRQRRNELSEAGKSGITEVIRQESVEIGKSLRDLEQKSESISSQFEQLYLNCPNILFDDVPLGDKTKNIVVKMVGEQPSFDFPIKNHLEIGEALGWINFEAGARMTGSQFPVYKDMGAKLVYALAYFMLKNNIKHGFQVILPPSVTNEKSLYVASNFPKFRDQVYAISEDNLFLSPTSEVVLTNLYRDHIFADGELPIRMTSWTSCFRREAGSYGATERGLIRIHQFEKCEIYTLCEPEYGEKEHKRMMDCAEEILQQLGLHYRVSLLAAQDCSFASAKTYDIEVWLPGQNAYYEVSSSSYCTDFQARRGAIRYKKHAMKKTELVHTLNTSSLAIPRLMVALLETYQKADGTVELPEVLKPFIL